MKSWLKHPLRVSSRLLWLGGELLLAAVSYAIRCAFSSSVSLPAARAAWLQRGSNRVLRIFRAETKVAGTVPSSGLLVCNHLSYLDVLVLASLAPCVFVSKSEVKHWPVFGWFARLAGTVFVHRARCTETAQTAAQIDAVLRTGVLVVLFPEGTSSGGESVLPFKSSLFEPATRQSHALTAGLIAYELADGDPSEEVCYWKDMTLVPHLVNLLSKRAVNASVAFTELPSGRRNRKELARQLHSEVLKLRNVTSRSLVTTNYHRLNYTE